MRRIFLTALAMAISPMLASAQQPVSSLDGKWVATHPRDDGGGERTSRLSISQTKGIWREFGARARGRENPCNGKEFPVLVQTPSQVEVVINVEASGVLQGCNDRKLTLQRIDADHLEGTLGDGKPIKLVRQQ